MPQPRTVGAMWTRQYGYDAAGRLTTVQDAVGSGDPDDAGSCTVRQYAFDAHGNRTKLTSTSSTAGCTTDGSGSGVRQSSTTDAFDGWSRQLSGANGSGSYVYDAFGRQTTVPASDAPNGSAGDITLGYYDTDAAHTITQGTVTTTYGLDPDGRRVTEAVAGSSRDGTTTDHYADGSDDPAWATSGASSTVYSPSIGTGLSAQVSVDGSSTTAGVDLADVAGNIVATVTIPATGDAAGIDGYTSYDEYGNPENGAAATGVEQYGWQGTAQRATGGAGLTLMGARLYNPLTGRFTSTDPVASGNENAYNYPNNPINQNDITGAISSFIKMTIRIIAFGIGYLAAAWACSVSALLCPIWKILIGGIKGALANGLIGYLEHFSKGRMVRTMVAGFFEGAAMATVLRVAKWFGLAKYLLRVGVRRLVTTVVTSLVVLVSMTGSRRLKRR